MRRRTKLPPEWRVRTTPELPKLRLTPRRKRVAAGALAAVFVTMFASSGGGRPEAGAVLDAPPPYYKNCAAARAAGAAPVRRADPGYASHLDGDNDGVGCEWG